MRTRRVIVWCVAALIVTATVVSLWPRQPVAPKPRDMTMRFVGFTNINGNSAAIFVCSNNSGIRLALDLGSIEYQSEGGAWQSLTNVPTVGGARTTRGLSMAGQANVPWMFPVHDTNIAWRLRVLCVETTTGVEGVIDKATDALESLAEHGKPGVITKYEGRNYEVTASSELAQ